MVILWKASSVHMISVSFIYSMDRFTVLRLIVFYSDKGSRSSTSTYVFKKAGLRSLSSFCGCLCQPCMVVCVLMFVNECSVITVSTYSNKKGNA